MCGKLAYSHASETYSWASIENCECGLGASIVKNQSLGVLFSKKIYPQGSTGFEIDFSGVNRIAFQVDNVFFNHDNNTMLVEKNKFQFAEAEQFIKLAHSYNTSVDLLISSKGGLRAVRAEQKPLLAGEVLILANDIMRMLSANEFDGVTVDLDGLFNHDLVSYRRLVQEIIKGLENRSDTNDFSVNVIISDEDLPALPIDSGEQQSEQERERQKNARLLLRLLDEGLNYAAPVRLKIDY
jgi:hypothetical protein